MKKKYQKYYVHQTLFVYGCEINKKNLNKNNQLLFPIYSENFNMLLMIISPSFYLLISLHSYLFQFIHVYIDSLIFSIYQYESIAVLRYHYQAIHIYLLERGTWQHSNGHKMKQSS